MTQKARFICRDLEGAAVPTTWTYPQAGTYAGAQVLSVETALDIALSGDRSDDWYSTTKYDRLAFFTVTGCSGERGPLTYDAITADDIIEMRVIDLDDLDNVLLEIAMDEDLFDADGMPDTDRIIEDHADEIIARASVVEPTFTDTLSV